MRITDRTSRTIHTPICALLIAACALPGAALADIKYPTNEDFRAFRTVCAGGEVQQIDARLQGALITWKASPGARVDVSSAIRDLGAVMEKVKTDAGSELYKSYVGCVQNLILKYLERMNPAPASPAAAPAPTKAGP